MTYGLTALQLVNSGSQIVMSADGGATIGRRTRISQPDDGNARCRASRAEVRRKDFSPSMQPPTTRSTFNAISFQQERTELFEPRPWTRGARPLLQREQDRQRDRSRLSFDNVTMPWKTFLRNHADGIASIDLFVVPTISFRLLYGLVILQHGRRQMLWLGVTAHPTAEWIARQLTEACGWERGAEVHRPRSRSRLRRDFHPAASRDGHS